MTVMNVDWFEYKTSQISGQFPNFRDGISEQESPAQKVMC
jgi:hypothetical protein